MTKQKSKYGRVNRRDVLNGFLTAILFSILASVYTAIQSGNFPPPAAEWKTVVGSGLSAGILFLLQRRQTNSNGKFLRDEPEKYGMPRYQNPPPPPQLSINEEKLRADNPREIPPVGLSAADNKKE